MVIPPSSCAPAGLGARVHHRELRPQHFAGRGRGHLRGEDGWGLRGAAGVQLGFGDRRQVVTMTGCESSFHSTQVVKSL